MKVTWLSALVLLTLVGCGMGSNSSNTNSSTTTTPAVAVSAEDEARRVTDPVGKFSYIPPKTWEYSSSPGLKYKISRGTPTGNFAPNIVIIDEAYAGDLDSYLAANERGVLKMLPKCVVKGKGDFTTNEGLAGKYLITENEQSNFQLRQSFYIFPKGGMMFIVTTSCLAKDGDKMAPMFEWSTKTFKF